MALSEKLRAKEAERLRKSEERAEKKRQKEDEKKRLQEENQRKREVGELALQDSNLITRSQRSFLFARLSSGGLYF